MKKTNLKRILFGFILGILVIQSSTFATSNLNLNELTAIKSMSNGPKWQDIFLDVTFKGLDYSHCIFDSLLFLSTDFSDSIGIGAKFIKDKSPLGTEYCGLWDCDFTNADLQKADFTGAWLRAVNFKNADVRGAIFKDTKCKNLTWPDGTEHHNEPPPTD